MAGRRVTLPPRDRPLLPVEEVTELRFFFREEIGHDAIGYPPPTGELALRRVASTRRTYATCLRATAPEVLG